MKAFKTSVLSLALTSMISVQAGADLKQGAAAAAQAAMPIAMMAAVSSAGTATVLHKPCMLPGGFAACVMMGLAIVQVGSALSQRSGSAQSASQLVGTGYGNGGGANADGTSLTDTKTDTYTLADGSKINGDAAKTANALVANGLGALADDYAKNAQTVQNSGVQVSPDGQTVKLPNGKTIPSSSMSSADSMKKAGFSNAEISNANTALQDASKVIAAYQSKVGSLTNDAGGGGSGGLGGPGGSGSGSGSGSGYGDSSAFGKLGLNGKGNKASVSGMSKKFGNDNIGVSGDNIFEMVSRRYQSKDKVDSFLKN
jgi:hypothetical protein